MKKSLIVFNRYALALTFSCVLFIGCDQNGLHQPINPEPGQDENSQGELVSYQEVQPVLAKNCTGCHVFAKDQASFDDAVKRGEVLRRVWTERENPSVAMPRGMAALTITLAERELIRKYALGVMNPTQNRNSNRAPEPSSPFLESPQFKTLMSCTQCHGENGKSTMPGVPHLAGLTYDYLLRQLTAFKKIKLDEQGQQVAAVAPAADAETLPADDVAPRKDSNNQYGHFMNKIVHDLSTEQMHFLASYFSLMVIEKNESASNEVRTPPPSQLGMCLGCHDGSRKSIGPLIHGQNSDYLSNQLKAYKTGLRSHSMMDAVSESLDPDTIEELAKYISGLSAQ